MWISQFRSVSSVHKGPIALGNLMDTYTNPKYQEISMEEGSGEQGGQGGQGGKGTAGESKGEMINMNLAEAITKAQLEKANSPKEQIQSRTEQRQSYPAEPTKTKQQTQTPAAYPVGKTNTKQ